VTIIPHMQRPWSDPAIGSATDQEKWCCNEFARIANSGPGDANIVEMQFAVHFVDNRCEWWPRARQIN